MSPILFTATGCGRCKIIKEFMTANGMAYTEMDIYTHGKEAFKEFYKTHRPRIYRGVDGVEFPLLYTRDTLFQGVGIILAHLMAQDRLKGFVTRSDLSHGWISGINLSAKPLDDGKDIFALLAALKAGGLSIELAADGINASLMDTLFLEKWVDRLVFYLRGPAALYPAITGFDLSPEDLARALSFLSLAPEHRIILPISVISGAEGHPRYLSPDEAALAAQSAAAATGNKKHPFFIQAPAGEGGALPELTQADLFKYRTACRPHMVLCDILKP